MACIRPGNTVDSGLQSADAVRATANPAPPPSRRSDSVGTPDLIPDFIRRRSFRTKSRICGKNIGAAQFTLQSALPLSKTVFLGRMACIRPGNTVDSGLQSADAVRATANPAPSPSRRSDSVGTPDLILDFIRRRSFRMKSRISGENLESAQSTPQTKPAASAAGGKSLGSVDTQHVSATAVIWDAAQGARSAVWSFQTSDEQRRDAPKLPPSLRVAPKCGACGVALLAKGTTLGFVARLAVIRIWGQRVSRDECQQTPFQVYQPILQPRAGSASALCATPITLFSLPTTLRR